MNQWVDVSHSPFCSDGSGVAVAGNLSLLESVKNLTNLSPSTVPSNMTPNPNSSSGGALLDNANYTGLEMDLIAQAVMGFLLGGTHPDPHPLAREQLYKLPGISLDVRRSRAPKGMILGESGEESVVVEAS